MSHAAPAIHGVDNFDDYIYYGIRNNSESSSGKRNFEFRNCNNTEVPIFFKNIDILPDPLVILTEKWLLNRTFDILVTKLITKMEVSFSLTLWTEEGNTELCYLLGDRCYVPDGCIYVNATALATGIHCPLYPGPYNRHFHLKFNPFPFIL
ncbi:hypothetical protein DPMN_108039 [Dreissena polymorpha]|uniref:Uncharacterized protein n=1 Tax=Dreissena polymorpha TaxID=45954 RepID=A0A9D4QKR5_DREPO|nr:hypothetical protein DPMN_108039 [Dreissena polymorpha]